MSLLAFVRWNPPREIFTIPFVERPVVFYGFFFALGFLMGYLLVIKMLTRFFQEEGTIKDPANLATRIADRLCWYIVAGTIIGSRLGYVFFYGQDYYFNHPLDILKIWEGGLASHGGAVGVILSLYLITRWVKSQVPTFTFFRILDLIVVPTALVAFCIRVGNFFNQEILGMPTTLPWAVIFENPADRSLVVPRHPVQLYEGFAYLATFFLLLYLWQTKGKNMVAGRLTGIFFVLIFLSRFFAEFVKSSQHGFLETSWLSTGQWLSIPFILGGLILAWGVSNDKKAFEPSS